MRVEGNRGPAAFGSGTNPGGSRFAKAECRLEAHIRRTKLSHSRKRTKSAKAVWAAIGEHLETDLPTIFDEYLKEVQGLPITSERLLWDRKVLREKDNLLEAANQRFRDRVFDACWALIDRLGQ